MEASLEFSPDLALVTLEGRLDAFGSKEADAVLSKALDAEPLGVIIDLAKVAYMSSAGLRVLAKAHTALHNRGGRLVVCSVQSYNMEVLRLSGFLQTFNIAEDRAGAEAHFSTFIQERETLLGWQEFEKMALPDVNFRILPATPDNRGIVKVTGSLRKVFAADVDLESIVPVISTGEEYSIGIGAMGERPEDFYPILGEIMSIGGTVVWLPTDGNDTPDFLIPAIKDSSLTIQTAFSLGLSGAFNDTLVFNSASPEGVTLDDLYNALFAFGRGRTDQYKGALGLAICAQVAEAWGFGIKKAPISANKPQNGQLISHPDNASDWFENPEKAFRENVTGLLCGYALDDLEFRDGLDPAVLRDAFSTGANPEVAAQRRTHTHGVFFSRQPLPERMVSIEREIRNVVEDGDFLDMRHLFGKTRLTRGLIAVSYVQEFRK